MRSSNCPRYLVPATMEAISRAMTRLSNSARDTFFCVIRSAKPSTIADYPHRVTDEYRIIFLPSAQYLRDALDLSVASHYRVEPVF